MIELRDLDVAIGARILLQNVSVAFSPGEFVAVLGRNGAGKTTLLRTICGLIPVHAGDVCFEGESLAVRTSAQRARAIAFVTSDDVMTEALRVRDVVAIGRYPHHAWWQWSATSEDERAIEEALGAVEMSAFGDRLFATLSSGERQRAWIAMGLAQETPVLLLDEPTSHLDVRVAHDILALLRRLSSKGKTIVSVLHDLNDAATYADRLLLLGEGGVLAYDAPGAVLTPEIIYRAYGIGVERVETSRGPRVFARSADPTTHPR
jgi:ABC-type cobalamin/Fe3+-siderophores transport system ATPase subunit